VETNGESLITLFWPFDFVYLVFCLRFRDNCTRPEEGMSPPIYILLMFTLAARGLLWQSDQRQGKRHFFQSSLVVFVLLLFSFVKCTYPQNLWQKCSLVILGILDDLPSRPISLIATGPLRWGNFCSMNLRIKENLAPAPGGGWFTLFTAFVGSWYQGFIVNCWKGYSWLCVYMPSSVCRPHSDGNPAGAIYN
jgi:hypothetical protein